jgi:exopolysaccharide production protein ExoZ
MILEFVLGVIAGGVFVNGRVGWPIQVAAACAITALLVTDPANRVIVSGLPSACLVAAAAFVSRRRIGPSWPERALARLGDASYSIYLAQVQTVSLASTSIAGLIPAIPPLLLVIVTTGIVVALGLLLNILVERPLLKLCRRLGGPRPPQVPLTRTSEAYSARGAIDFAIAPNTKCESPLAPPLLPPPAA